MTRSDQRASALPLFAALALLVYLGNYAISGAYSTHARAPVPAVNANLRLTLHPEAQLETLWGRRPVHDIYLALDEPVAFAMALHQRLPR